MTPGIAIPALIRSNARRDIMCQHDAVLGGSACEHFAVACPAQPDILRSYGVEVGYAALEPTQHVVVEVLVREESRHRPAGGGRRASKRPRSPFGGA
jgi:hypothetical protein